MSLAIICIVSSDAQVPILDDLLSVDDRFDLFHDLYVYTAAVIAGYLKGLSDILTLPSHCCRCFQCFTAGDK